VIASLAFILWWPWHDWHEMNVVDGMPEDHTPVCPMLLAIPGVIVGVVMLVRTDARKPGSDTDARRD
jgi:hypothetical protein